MISVKARRRKLPIGLPREELFVFGLDAGLGYPLELEAADGYID